MGGPQSTRDSKDTKLQILRTAERLYAERGLGQVSLREISAAANQRNHSAVQYHFGDEQGLLNALMRRHSEPTHERWQETLNLMELSGPPSLEALVTLLVQPILAKIEDEDGGPAYLALCNQLLVHPSLSLLDTDVANTDASRRLMMLIGRHTEKTSPGRRRLKMHRLVSMIYQSTSAYMALQASGSEEPDLATFTADVIEDVIHLLAPRPRAG
jgi:AcrR family transcriptional regulator